MTKVGELLFFLREKAERLLIDAETEIKLLSRLPSAKLGESGLVEFITKRDLASKRKK